MYAIHVKSKSESLNRWRVAKTIRPDQRGAIKLTRLHGDDLVCVRYRESPQGTERLTTIELVVEHAVIQKRTDPMVYFKIKPSETKLMRRAMSRGAQYNSRTQMWRMLRSEVLRLGLKSRIAVTREELLQEQVHP